MICLADNDLIFKLSACALTEECFQLLQVRDEDVRVLATARFWFESKIEPTKLHRPSLVWAVEAAHRRVQTWPQYAGPLDLPIQATLLTLGIDTGEATFLAANAPDCEFVTSDRKCINKLSNAARTDPKARAIHQKWKGRVSWFDSLLLALIQRHGISLVHSHLYPGRLCDGGLRDAFRNGQNTPSAEIINYLQARVTQTETHANGLLRTFSP